MQTIKDFSGPSLIALSICADCVLVELLARQLSALSADQQKALLDRIEARRKSLIDQALRTSPPATLSKARDMGMESERIMTEIVAEAEALMQPPVLGKAALPTVDLNG